MMTTIRVRRALTTRSAVEGEGRMDRLCERARNIQPLVPVRLDLTDGSMPTRKHLPLCKERQILAQTVCIMDASSLKAIGRGFHCVREFTHTGTASAICQIE